MKHVYILIMMILTLSGCSKGNENYNVESFIKKLPEESKFTLSSVCKQKIDSVYILQPYSYKEIYKTSINMPNNLKKMLEFMSNHNDNTYILIFSKENNFINYSEITSDIANFSNLKKKKYSIKQTFFINKERKISIYNK